MTAAKRKEIVFYTEIPFTGGVSAVMEELCFASSLSYDCTVVCKDNENLRAWGDRLAQRNIRVLHAALHNNADLFGWFEMFSLIKAYRIFGRADLIHFHLHTPFSCIPAIAIAHLSTAKKIVSTEHYVGQIRFLRRRQRSFVIGLIRELVIALKFMFKKMSLFSIDKVVTVSNGDRRFFLSSFGARHGNKVMAIPNGVDVKRFATLSSDTGRARQVVTTIAGLSNQKGHEYLIRVIPLVRKQCPDARFIFAGDGHLRSFLETLARNEGVMELVTFAGHVENVQVMLSESDVIVLPSLFEGMPVSILEAMAASKPVVATNVDGTSEVVVDGVTGFLVPPKNPGELAEKIARLLQDRSLRERFGRNGQERVTKEFSVERMTGNYLQLFDQLVQQSNAS